MIPTGPGTKALNNNWFIIMEYKNYLQFSVSKQNTNLFHFSEVATLVTGDADMLREINELQLLKAENG